jgi:hypothetical protein
VGLFTGEEIRRRRRKEMGMMCGCFTWFLIRGLGESNYIPELNVDYKK